jgi:hypothetical protein
VLPISVATHMTYEHMKFLLSFYVKPRFLRSIIVNFNQFLLPCMPDQLTF